MHGGRTQVVHFDRLKPYERRETLDSSESMTTQPAEDSSQLERSDAQDPEVSLTAIPMWKIQDVGSTGLDDDLPDRDTAGPHHASQPAATRLGRVRNLPAWMRRGDYELYEH